MRSLERHLLVWVMGALMLGAAGLSLVSYIATLDEMNEVFNENLRQVALSIAAYHQAANEGAQPTTAMQLATDHNDGRDATDLVALTWTPQGKLTFTSDPHAWVPFTRRPGASVALTAKGEGWHLYTVLTRDGVVQAAQSVSARREMAAESATKVFLPLVAFVAVIGALLVVALRRGLKPLDAAAGHVAARTAVSLEPISVADIPREIHPLVQAINAMMQRLAVAFDAQRRFVADAAHELRTPMTALRLQLQLLHRADDEPARRTALTELQAGIDRSEHLVAQLLRLSRADPAAASSRMEPVDLAELVRSVVATLCVQAEHKGIDLGAGGANCLAVEGDQEQLLVMLNNLVGNAIRYTHRGGVIDVTAEEIEGRPVVSVTDNGPGIPDSERARVFDRFYRGEGRQSKADSVGTGLGLSIALAVASSHGAAIELRTPDSGRGLEVRVVFAAASATRSSHVSMGPSREVQFHRTEAPT